MKTAEEYWDRFMGECVCGYDRISIMPFREAIEERDKEWKQKIQTALAETSNWNCKEVLTKLLEEK